MTQHHPTHPQPAAHTPARLPPATAPSFKDLLRRTRSPLRMTHQKPTALFSKKASTLPIRFFSWSAAASLGMLATFSFDAPVQAQGCKDIYGNSHTSLSVSNGTLDPSWTCLNIYESGVLTSIDLSGLSRLTSLGINANDALRSINLSGLSRLDRLSIIGNNRLTSLDLSGLSRLDYLRISNNDALRSINLSGLSRLDHLRISNNDALRSINLSGLSRLTILEILNHGSLTNIIFPRVCNDLRFVDISDNRNFGDLFGSEVKARCGTQENRPPTRTSEPWSITRRVNLDVIRRNQQTFNLDKYFTDPDGDNLTYTASSSNNGVRAEVRGNTLYLIANPDPGLLSLLPTVTVTASDGKGGTVSDTFGVTVSNDELSEATGGLVEGLIIDGSVEAAKGAIQGTIIGKVGKAVGAGNKAIKAIKAGASAADGIKGMFKTFKKSDNSGGRSIYNLAEALYLNHNALQKGYISLDQAFSGQDFSVPFSLAQTDSQDQGSSPRFNALLSADIGFSRFSDSSDPELSIDGTTTNYGIGLTVIPNPEVSLVTGLQLGYTRSNSDFEHTEMEGSYNLRMFSVSPYVAWDATDSLTVWSAIGYGRPNEEMIIESVDGVDFDSTEDSTFTSSGDFFSFSGGANYRVWQSDLSALSIGLSGSTTSFLGNDSKDGSISAQFSHNFPLNTGQLQTSADLALILSDSGPSATELSGNLNWLPNKGRLSGSTNARVLLFGGDRSEWGIGGSVTLLPGERGEGLSLALRPSFGQTSTSLSNLHLDPFSFSDPTELAISTAPLTARFNAELAYGFRTGNHALLTPYTKLSMGHYGTTTSAGLRYQLDNSLDLDLSASHRTRSSGNNDNRFFLQLRSDL